MGFKLSPFEGRPLTAPAVHQHHHRAAQAAVPLKHDFHAIAAGRGWTNRGC